MNSTSDLSILPDDLERIRTAVTIWKSPGAGQAFWGARVADYATSWAQFVDTDWSSWDPSEYNHDIGCRHWLQVVLEHCAAPTRARLESEIRSTDLVFHSRSSEGKPTAGGRRRRCSRPRRRLGVEHGFSDPPRDRLSVTSHHDRRAT